MFPFCFIEPTEEQEKFFDQWSKINYKEEIEQQKDDFFSSFSDMMNDFFDMDNDKIFDDNENGSERFQQFQEQIYERINKESNCFHKRKKTNKQIEEEQTKKLEEEIKGKTLRTIYITLAKILHPDIETDPELKLQKEELMKQLVEAYGDKDLSKLFRLELE